MSDNIIILKELSVVDTSKCIYKSHTSRHITRHTSHTSHTLHHAAYHTPHLSYTHSYTQIRTVYGPHCCSRLCDFLGLLHNRHSWVPHPKTKPRMVYTTLDVYTMPTRAHNPPPLMHICCAVCVRACICVCVCVCARGCVRYVCGDTTMSRNESIPLITP